MPAGAGIGQIMQKMLNDKDKANGG